MSNNNQNYNSGNQNGYPSDYSITKPWGGMQNFMNSYGLKMSSDSDYQEAKAIVSEMKQAQYQSSHQSNQQNSNKR
jgi:hypothetical protein